MVSFAPPPGLATPASGRGEPTTLACWLDEMGEARRDAFFAQIIRVDAALALALPTTYAALDQVSRVALLVLSELARDHAMNAGELALLIDAPEVALLEALAQLSDERLANVRRAD